MSKSLLLFGCRLYSTALEQQFAAESFLTSQRQQSTKVSLKGGTPTTPLQAATPPPGDPVGPSVVVCSNSDMATTTTTNSNITNSNTTNSNTTNSNTTSSNTTSSNTTSSNTTNSNTTNSNTTNSNTSSSILLVPAGKGKKRKRSPSITLPPSSETQTKSTGPKCSSRMYKKLLQWYIGCVICK